MNEDDHREARHVLLEPLCRALAAHVMLTRGYDDLHAFLGPEKAEQVADFIYRFAIGERVNRPKPSTDQL